LVRICQLDGLYGFSEPFQFTSVVELVNYYRTHSLSEYNQALDIVLSRPVSRFSVFPTCLLTVVTVVFYIDSFYFPCLLIAVNYGSQ